MKNDLIWGASCGLALSLALWMFVTAIIDQGLILSVLFLYLRRYILC